MGGIKRDVEFIFFNLRIKFFVDYNVERFVFYLYDYVEFIIEWSREIMYFECLFFSSYVEF